jgi:transcriptional regulator with XRE-family HTH domain
MACSLGGLSQRRGVTKGSLSRVERDETSASIASLVGICDALELSMADLFPTPQTTLVRRDDRPRNSDLPKAVDVVDTLVTPARERHATVLETTAAPGGSGRVADAGAGAPVLWILAPALLDPEGSAL